VGAPGATMSRAITGGALEEVHKCTDLARYTVGVEKVDQTSAGCGFRSGVGVRFSWPRTLRRSVSWCRGVRPAA
jgi:hypothetical protein